MGKSASISRMQQAILNYLNANIPEDKNKARVGTVSGKRVVIDNKSYSYTPVVDMHFEDGDKIFCLLPDNGNYAAVVGVT